MQDTSAQSRRLLRNLYVTRTVVQLAWAVLLFRLSDHPQAVAAFLVFYPLWDVACNLYDLRTSGQDSSARSAQLLNIALGLVTALAIGLTVMRRPTYSIASFGVWALAAGLLQLVSGLSRRKRLGGQWAMILSGAQSALAGVAFFLGGLNGKFQAKDLGGYAIFGGIYFLIGGILIGRKLPQATAVRGMDEQEPAL
jgi:short repeat uncharacterized protein DUF308